MRIAGEMEAKIDLFGSIFASCFGLLRFFNPPFFVIKNLE
jgi:hypothetical protein